MVARLIVVVLLVSAALAPARASAQESHDGQVAAATTLAGVGAALATWPLLMPWEGFWRDEPDPANGWAITGALAAGGLVSLATWGLAQGHPERAEILQVTSMLALGIGAAIAMYGALGMLLADFDRLAFSLFFGVPALATLAVGLVVASVHAAIEGDRAPSAEPVPIVVALPLWF